MLFTNSFFLPDEENTTEHTPTHHMLQPPQAVFPACICAAVLPIVHLMEDGEVREDGVAGSCHYTKKWICIKTFVIFFFGYLCKNVSSVSAVAQQILWNCLIEDPALVLRHFLEKLTVSNRQVGKHLRTDVGKRLAMSFLLFVHLFGFCTRTSWCTCLGSSCSTLEICQPRPLTSFLTTWWVTSYLHLYLYICHQFCLFSSSSFLLL